MEEESKPDLALFYNLDYENKTCLDCRGALPRFISINNAIILCKSCAQLHKELGFNVSFIREVDDEWDPYLLSFIQRGGNGRFIRFSDDFKLNELPIHVKYKTKAAEYYRKLILSEVLADDPPEPILMDVALEECFNTIYFPEFDNYTIFKGEKQGNSQRIGLSGKVLQSLQTVGEGLGNATLYIGETVTNPKIKDTIVNGGTATYEGIKTASGIIYDYSQPVVSFIASKTVQGLGFLFGKIENSVNDYQNKQFKIHKDQDEEEKTLNPKLRTNAINEINCNRAQIYTHNNCHCQNHFNNCCCYNNNQQSHVNQSQSITTPKPHCNTNESQMSQITSTDKTCPMISSISSSKQSDSKTKPLLTIEQMSSLAIDQNKTKDKNKDTKKKYSMAPCKENPTYEVIIRDKKKNDIKKQVNLMNITNQTNNINNNENN